MQIPGYHLEENLGESSHSTVYRGYLRAAPDQMLVIKVLEKEYLSEQSKAQFKQKIEHLKVLDHELIITPLGFGDLGGMYFLSQQFFAGESLDHLMKHRPHLPLHDFFRIACPLVQALESVHNAGIIHGGIKPRNILVSPHGLEVRLIDFLSAVDVRRVSHFIYDPSFVRYTLCYTSPEQTGRINHRVGFASDLYSLGVLFHEMLSGQLPFYADDPLELIHCHLAKEAPPVHELNPGVPPILSRIVAKLLLKQPEKRYGSGGGLLEDLLRCREEYGATGSIGEFSLENDLPFRRTSFISKMVGRQRETEAILGDYEDAAAGKFRALFISGWSGIGKTRLIQELQKPIVKRRGYFTSGKFDLYLKNIPYSSLIQALRNLIQTFLTESDQRVALWRARIFGAVGVNGRVLIDVIPELEALIGEQPEVRQLPPVESLNRFHDTIDRFLISLASEENPLTLFIDDLQWCDAASVDFLANLLSRHDEHPHLFLLGAYRHNEVDQSHPLAVLIGKTLEYNCPLREIRLAPLEPRHTHEMVSYILDSPGAKTAGLSNFIDSLSEGNPLFISESLSYLCQANLLYLDRDRQWRWDLNNIKHSRMPTTVVDLFSSKIRKLPPEVATLLEYCACMGNSFHPDAVSALRGNTLLQTFQTLKPALGQGLLVEHHGWLQFIHDRVQEAVLAGISAQRRRAIHREIGRHLLEAGGSGVPHEKRENLFALVSHLNLGRESDPGREERYLLCDINFHAGNRALDSLATQAANDYFNLALELLPDDCWEEPRYEGTFRIFQRAAKTRLMCGAYLESERLLARLLEQARSDLDRAECLAEQTTSLSSIGNFIKAIETANRGLSLFDKDIPFDAAQADQRRGALIQEISAFGEGIVEHILNMPFTGDRRSKIELAFYSELIPDLYMSGLVPQLYLSAVQSTHNCLSGGMDESVIYSFSIMGLQLGEQWDFQQAFRYEDLARELSARHPNTFGATRGMNGIVWCNMHSRSHPRDIVEYCLKGIQCGKNCGDLYNAGLCYGPLMWNQQVQGADFAQVEETVKECLQFSDRYHLSFSAGLADAMLAGWVEPMKPGGAPRPMAEKVARWERDNHVASAGSYYVHRALCHYYFGEYQEAQQHLQAVNKYLSGLTDNVLKRQCRVFQVLSLLKMHEMGKWHGSWQELVAEYSPLLEQVEIWAGLGPLLRPYLALLHAEIARVSGGFVQARSHYLDAISLAHRQGYVFLEGYLNQCLGELYLASGEHPGRAHLVEAGRLYRKCRAGKLEELLAQRHPECFEEEQEPVLPVPEAPAPPRTLPNLDLDYLIKSSQAISAEMELDALLKKVMNVVMESSGAQHGYLLMHDGELVIRAESHTADSEGTRIVHTRVTDHQEICKAVPRYVYRTRERIILCDATKEGPFTGNQEVQALQLRSLLCLPVVSQAKLMAVLYLENRLSEGVFTEEKTRMTELLTSQAAISLENSRLVSQLKDAVREQQSFSYTVSHDLRAPLRHINSYSHIIREDWGGLLPEQGLRYLERICAATRNMGELIDHLLVLSRISRSELTLEQVNLSQLAEEVFEVLRESGPPREAQLSVEEGICVLGDRALLRQLLENLLGNAWKYTLKVEAPSISFKRSRPCGMEAFCVADNGAGFDMAFKSKLFEPFERLHGEEFEGMGIGLATAQRIVQRHGGTIWGEGHVGKGASFFFTLQS